MATSSNTRTGDSTRDEDFEDYSHTGPGTPAGRYLRQFWQPIYRSQDLVPGQSAPVMIMGQELTVYRGESGAVHLLAGRCAHRATLLATGWVEGDCVRCFYHGWTYDSTGQCIEQPAEDEGFASKIRISSYPTQEYLGLIFAYLGEGEPLPLPRYAFMEQSAASGHLGWAHVDKVPYPFNYRNGLENSVDPVHVAFVHRESEYGGLKGCPQVSAEETGYGLLLRAHRPDGGVRVTQFQMPNVLFIKQGPRYPEETGWRDFLLWRVPVDDESFRGYRLILARAPETAHAKILASEEALMENDPAPAIGESCLAGKARADKIPDLRLAVNVQDYVAQKGQGVVYDRVGEKLGRSDVGIILLRKIYAREMRALYTGAAMKSWAALVPIATVGTAGAAPA